LVFLLFKNDVSLTFYFFGANLSQKISPDFQKELLGIYDSAAKIFALVYFGWFISILFGYDYVLFTPISPLVAHIIFVSWDLPFFIWLKQ